MSISSFNQQILSVCYVKWTKDRKIQISNPCTQVYNSMWKEMCKQLKYKVIISKMEKACFIERPISWNLGSRGTCQADCSRGKSTFQETDSYVTGKSQKDSLALILKH